MRDKCGGGFYCAKVVVACRGEGVGGAGQIAASSYARTECSNHRIRAAVICGAKWGQG